jgi:IS5 family transposase
MQLDPVLMQLDHLRDADTLFQAVKADLATRYPRTLLDGRPATPVEVILRRLVVKQRYNWSYDHTEQWVADRLVVRQFCRVYAERVPDDPTLIRWAKLIPPAPLHHLLDHMVDLARQRKVTRGRTLRSDGTVGETNSHHPTASPLWYAGIRVLSRTRKPAAQLLQDPTRLAGATVRSRTRSAKRHMKRIMEGTRQRGEQAEQALRAASHPLLNAATAMVQPAVPVAGALRDAASRTAQRLADPLDQYGPLVAPVVSQTTRRVRQGAQVPARAKVVSWFEPHTAIIRKGQRRRPPALGRAGRLDEVDGGLISRAAVLAGNPDAAAHRPASLDQHLAVFAKPPRRRAGDRTLATEANEPYARQQGIGQVVLPARGAKSAERIAYERQRWFRRGRTWRAGIEGRISGLKRGHGLERCRYHGDDGMARWVGWGVITHDLRVIAQATAEDGLKALVDRNTAWHGRPALSG